MSNEALPGAIDLVVIGAGPAGLAAAALAAESGVAALLLDENAEPGGQIYRAITSTPMSKPALLGEDYWHGARLVEAARKSGARIAHGATVWSLDRDLQVGVSLAGTAQMIKARRVIIATGAMERPFPIPGWTLPGVMTVGGAQTLLKAAGLVASGRTVIAGMGPLLWLYAAQALRAGGEIAAILDTTPRGSRLRALPHLPGFLAAGLLKKGLALMREVKAKIPIITGVTELAAEGDGAVAAVRYAVGSAPDQRIEAETLLLHQGVVPNTNLAMAAGVGHEWDGRQHCWRPVLDRDGNTSVPGIAIAGDGAGIAGAWAAEERGRIAAIAAARALAPGRPVIDDQAIRQRLARHERGRAFLDTMFEPPAAHRIPARDDTLVCRCEEVTAGQIRANVALGCEGPNQMKSFVRCGMGPCQGRLCALTVTEVMAAARGVPPAEIGTYRLRPPVKPITLAELAALPAGDAAVKAVQRR